MDANVIKPIVLKKQDRNKIGSKDSIKNPVEAAARDEVNVIIAEPRPEALPASDGTAFTISAFDAGHIIPAPKVISNTGK